MVYLGPKYLTITKYVPIKITIGIGDETNGNSFALLSVVQKKKKLLENYLIF